MAGAEQAAGYTSKCGHTGMTSFYKIVGKSVGFTAAVCTKGGWPEWLRLSKRLAHARLGRAVATAGSHTPKVC